jgi:hypothetical protein
VTMENGAAFAEFVSRVATTIEVALALRELCDYAEALDTRLRHLKEVTRTLRSTGDVRLTLSNASVYLEAFGHITVAWIWLEQSLAVHGKSGDFYDGKRSAARYFLRWELPKVDPQLELLGALDRTPLDMRDEWF